MRFDDFQTLLEKRSNADKNEKTSLSKEIMKVIDNNNIYVHFSNKNIVGINPTPGFNTPAGVYAWQLNAYKKEIKHRIQSSIEDAKNQLAYTKKDQYSNKSDNVLDYLRRIADGQDIMINSTFPYRSDAKYVYILEAKSGLKWYKLEKNKETLSDSEYFKNIEILETFILNSNVYAPMFTVRDLSDFVGFLEAMEEQLENYNKFFAKKPVTMEEIRKEVDRSQEDAKRWFLRLDIFASFAGWNPYAYKNILLYTLINNIHNFLPEGRQANMKNVIYREMGYDAIRDNGSGTLFNWDERFQVVFLHPKAYTVRTMLLNTDLSRNERQELFGKNKPKPRET